MLKCPYCYNPLEFKVTKCPHCSQFIIDDVVEVDFLSADKKACLFCGKHIFRESKVCQFCHKWFEDVDQRINDVDLDDLV